MKVKILRQQAPGAESWWQTFDAEVDGEMSVASLLDHINFHDDIVDETGTKAQRIGWECSCRQGVCGACAMVIDGRPRLACETFVKDLAGPVIEIRPLRKFPVVRDLIVDRSSIQQNLQQANAYIEKYEPAPPASGAKGEKELLHHYTAAKCLKCGLCLEVCPNYVDGRSFFGAVFANDCYLVYARSSANSAAIREQYVSHVGSGCSKALSCMDVCPMQIPTIASMAKLNHG